MTSTPDTAPAIPERVSEPSVEELSSERGVQLLQRVILPRAGDPSKVRSLYLDEKAGRVQCPDRTTVHVPGGRELSFATYFNAFPASYWRRWTGLETVVLRMTVEGRCRVDVFRSKASGEIAHVTGAAPGKDGTIEFELDLTPFVDGGWYWFDVTADEDCVVTAAGWHASSAPVRDMRLSVGICTFNRPDDCVAALTALGGDEHVLSTISDVIVADQGNRKVVDAARFGDAAERLGDRLRVVEQPNLGGSGGFARTMVEMLENTQATHHVFLDDDILIEPDCIARAAAFARYTTTSTLVGGQMLALQDRSVLHVMGEVIENDKFFWRNAPHTQYSHDFSEYSLKESPELHRRIDVDYNGWWMCLIPRDVAEKVGLPLPLFIKWDDAEYGLRANAAGHPTVTLPGVAIWHLSWMDKDDATDWQAYFHWRNRLVVAALYSPHRRGRGLLRDLFKWDLKYLIMLQYSATALHQRAYEDFLRGPDHLFESLPTALREAREEQASYPDGRVVPATQDLPLPSMSPLRAEQMSRIPTTPVSIARTLLGALTHNLFPVHGDEDRPQLNVPAQDARWFLMARLDSATVGTADGRGVTWRRRDPETFWKLLAQSLKLQREIYRRFPEIQRAYRDAMPELTGREGWHRVFGR